MKQRQAILILGLLPLLIGFLFWQFNIQIRGRRLVHENYTLVRMGMSQAEVEELLGGPPGNYGHTGTNPIMSAEGYRVPSGAVERIWCDDSNRFEIYFDAAGLVIGHHRRAGYSQPVPEGFFDWMRKQLVSPADPL
jgi:hypothetical protein